MNLETTLMRKMMTTNPMTIWMRSEEADTLWAPVDAWAAAWAAAWATGWWATV
jgi:hypothetical protein